MYATSWKLLTCTDLKKKKKDTSSKYLKKKNTCEETKCCLFLKTQPRNKCRIKYLQNETESNQENFLT